MGWAFLFRSVSEQPVMDSVSRWILATACSASLQVTVYQCMDVSGTGGWVRITVRQVLIPQSLSSPLLKLFLSSVLYKN